MDITIILSVIFLAYLALTFKHDMQMMQQNSYRNERYIKWLKMSSDASTINRLLIILSIFILIAFPYDWAKLSTAVIVAGMFYREIRTKYKKPLVFTKRVWRLYISVCIFAVAIISAVVAINWEYVPIAILVITALSYFFTLACNWILKPVEQSISQSYIDDAKKRLSQMPDMKIIGITGSYGKTSTKHYLNRILNEKYNVLMTPGSFNTPMGVVRTVRELMQPYHEIFIVEMGAKNIGDISEICEIVHPSIGIITAVGPQHLESFKTIENVQHTKFELVDALPEDGLAVVNNDFLYVANREIKNVSYKRYGVAHPESCNFHAENIEYGAHGTTFTIVGDNGESITIQTKLVGECNISNLIAAIIVAIHLQVPADKIKYAVSKIEQVEHRLNMKHTPGGVTIIDDAYNSNPDGSRMALDVISKMKGGKRIVITPGMIELGDKQFEYNEAFGKHMASCCDIAMVVGNYNREAILKGLKDGNIDESRIMVVDSFAEAQEKLKSILSPGDFILYENDLPDTFK